MVAAIGVGILLAPMTVIWLVENDPTVDWFVAFRASADVWMLSQGADLVVAPGALGSPKVPGFAVTMGKLGGLAVLNLEGVQTRYENADEQLDRIGAMLKLIHLKEQAHRTAGLLSHGQKQWLEIGMLLMQDPALLMLDEPVAGMSVNERMQTAELLKRISKGRSVLVIEHDMEFVKSIAHKVTVLHQGKVLAEGSMEAVQSNPKVIEVYLGH